jgi:hypothetical protein
MTRQPAHNAALAIQGSVQACSVSESWRVQLKFVTDVEGEMQH